MNELNLNLNIIGGDDGDSYISNIKNAIKSTNLIMIIMRGLPGSGKSHLASEIKLNGIVLSTDDYFINKKGVYVFDKRKLNDAHSFTKLKAKEALKSNITPIIIDNTNIKLWEFEPYIKMACESGYQVKLVEPNTLWKNKINELAKRNKHEVPYEKLKQMKIDYESNIDLNKLINSFKTIQPVITTPPKANKTFKSSGLLFGTNENFESFLEKNGSEWYMFDTSSTTTLSMNSSKSITSLIIHQQKIDYSTKEVQTGVVEEDEEFLSNNFKYLLTKPRDIQVKSRNSSSDGGSDVSSKILKYDRSCDTLDLNESLFDSKIEESIQMLNELFGRNYEKSYLADLLMKYDNDLNIVANLLTENIELNQVLKQQPLKLSDICTKVLDNMNSLLVQHYSHAVESEESIDYSGSDESDSMIEVETSSSGSEKVINNLIQDNDQKTFQFKLDKKFAKTLFDEFADPQEVFNENDSFNVECDLNLAFEIFKSWKKSRFKKSRNNSPLGSAVDYEDEDIEIINEKIRQIESDAQLALEIELESMYHPIDGSPIHLNPNAVSLRSIMAEQRAEQNLKTKNTIKQQHHDIPSRYSQNPTLAIRLKRKQIHESFSTMDVKLLDEIFFKNNYDANSTIKFIESKYGIKPNALPIITNNIKPIEKKKKKVSIATTYVSKEEATEYRELAHEHFQIRQKYFEKASEAHQRGWGGVAQYYAEMGRQQSIYMNKSNDVAAVNIFSLNNLDLNNSNTLDLHGLHVNEAFKMFKQVYLKKKEEYRHCNKNNKKQNRYLFVITGWGRHSVNKNARLRPQIMRHLNNNSIKFEEPHIGLIRVDLV